MANSKVWSAKQTAIFTWFSLIVPGVIRHLVVRARAGTGKTTTIIEALNHVPKGLRVLVCAFGKDIQLELDSRVKKLGITGVDVRTLHSLGYARVMKFWPGVKVEKFSSTARQDWLTEQVCGVRCPDTVKALVSKLCTKGRLIVPHASKMGDLTSVAIEFECTPDEAWEADGFGLDYVEARALEAMELASKKPTKTGIDGADMIFLPVRNGWLSKTYDVVIVDEGQDMNACQLEIAEGLCKTSMVVVGDDRQAIFAFAGADSGSLDRLKKELNADELPLNTTYRCGKSITTLAATLVPDFEAGPDNIEGLIRSLEKDKLTTEAGPSDFILSRVNAPLVSIAMKLLRAGKRTRVAGQEIGAGLVSLVRKLRARSVPDFLAKIESWAAKETRRLEIQLAKATNGRRKTIESKIEAIADKADMLIALSDGAPSVEEITTRIEALFIPDDKGDAGMIICSSIHKAKGKEARRVFVLANTLRSGGEEDNIAYVAYTRAIAELVLVS